MINWKTRLKNKAWLASVASAVVLAAQQLLPLFGVEFDGGRIMDAINALLMAGVAIGILIDPTTPGVKDGDK